MQQFRVHIPDRDTNWEMTRMFNDQLQRHNMCDGTQVTECITHTYYDSLGHPRGVRRAGRGQAAVEGPHV